MCKHTVQTNYGVCLHKNAKAVL